MDFEQSNLRQVRGSAWENPADSFAGCSDRAKSDLGEFVRNPKLGVSAELTLAIPSSACRLSTGQEEGENGEVL